jgi:hypothetical protein
LPVQHLGEQILGRATRYKVLTRLSRGPAEASHKWIPGSATAAVTAMCRQGAKMVW